MSDQLNYEALEARLTDPSTPIERPAEILTGTAAAAYGRGLLLREYGSDTAIKTAMRRGRPKVGSRKQGPSPVVRGAIPHEEFEAFRKLERVTGSNQSELVRRAVHDMLVAEKLVS